LLESLQPSGDVTICDNAYKLILLVRDSRMNRLEERGNDENHGGQTNNDAIGRVNLVNYVGIG